MNTMEAKLEQSRITLTNALNNPQLLAILEQYGYGAYRLHEGLALYETARNLVQSENSAHLNKKNATKSFQQLANEVQRHYQLDLYAAREALKQNSEARSFLQLDGVRNRDFDGWREQVKDFYYGLQNHPELQVVVAEMGLSAERLAQGIQYLQQLETLRAQKYEEHGGAIDSRQQRNDALEMLSDWMVTFRGVARLALANHPAHLARLNLNPAARRTAKKDDTTTVESAAGDSMNLLAVEPKMLSMAQAAS